MSYLKCQPHVLLLIHGAAACPVLITYPSVILYSIFSICCVFFVCIFLGYSVVNPRLAEPLCKKKNKKARNFIAVLVRTMSGLFGNVFGVLR